MRSSFNTTQKIQHRKIQHKKYNKHVQQEVEWSLPEISMIEKGSKQQYVEI